MFSLNLTLMNLFLVNVLSNFRDNQDLVSNNDAEDKGLIRVTNSIKRVFRKFTDKIKETCLNNDVDIDEEDLNSPIQSPIQPLTSVSQVQPAEFVSI